MTNNYRPTIEVSAGGQLYSGWKSIHLYFDLESLAHTFRFSARFNLDDEVELKAGLEVEITINDEKVLTGYIDYTEKNVADEDYSIELGGRSKTADLVDCSAEVKQIKDRDAQAVATEICEPFGIDVIWESEKEAKAITWKVEPGDTVFDVLNKIARESNLILTTNPEGNVVFMDAGEESFGTLTLGNELLELRVLDDWSERYSDYTAVGYTVQYKNPDYTEDGGTVRGPGYTKTLVKDDAIDRYRPIMIQTDDQAKGNTAKERAEYERDRNIANGKMIDATVRTWESEQGLWRINKRLTLDAPKLIDDEEYLIVIVELILDEDQGYITHLTASPPEGYSGEMYQDRPNDDNKMGKRRDDLPDYY